MTTRTTLPRHAATCALLATALVACERTPSTETARATPASAGDEHAAPPPSRPAGPPWLTLGEDLSARARERNAERFRPPPSVFRSIEVHPMEPPRVERFDGGWRAHLPSRAPVTTPTVHGGRLIASGGFRSRHMFAFDARSGEPIWSIGLGDDGPSAPACAGETCVFNTESCTLFAVDAATGEKKWAWYIGDPLMSAPAIADGKVLAAYPIRGGGTWPEGEDRPLPEDATHALGAFDLETGELLWARWIDADVISAPVVVMGHVYAATFGGTLYHLLLEDGAVLEARVARATSAPALVDGALYFARRENEGNEAWERIVRGAEPPPLERPERAGKPDDPPAQATPRRRAAYLEREFQARTRYSFDSEQLDAANGFADGAPAAANAQVALGLIGRATVHGLQEYQGSWVLGAGAHNLATMGTALVGYDRRSGREAWTVPLPGDLAQQGGALAAPPARAGGRAVLATLSGEVLIVDPSDGEVERRLDAGAPLRTQAVVEGGRVFVGTANGQVVALETGDASLTGWPTWAGDAARTGAP